MRYSPVHDVAWCELLSCLTDPPLIGAQLCLTPHTLSKHSVIQCCVLCPHLCWYIPLCGRAVSCKLVKIMVLVDHKIET